MLALWGGGTVFAYGRVLLVRRRAYALHHDRRARRDYLSAFGLFIVALLAGSAVGFVLFEEQGQGLRPFVITLALGAFLAVGILMATEKAER